MCCARNLVRKSIGNKYGALSGSNDNTSNTTHTYSESLIHAFPDAYLRDALLHLEKQKASLEKTQNSMRNFELRISGMRRVADLTDEYL